MDTGECKVVHNPYVHCADVFLEWNSNGTEENPGQCQMEPTPQHWMVTIPAPFPHPLHCRFIVGDIPSMWYIFEFGDFFAEKRTPEADRKAKSALALDTAAEAPQQSQLASGAVVDDYLVEATEACPPPRHNDDTQSGSDDLEGQDNCSNEHGENTRHGEARTDFLQGRCQSPRPEYPRTESDCSDFGEVPRVPSDAAASSPSVEEQEQCNASVEEGTQTDFEEDEEEAMDVANADAVDTEQTEQ
eukprot:NODE_394_length_944_cov_161.638246_g386_i0.p1 GENE.NODE_394_length_944_cov_161.638246_g386_i0~~NODE_394_length_944_cov_161.638246_g386_i0.p1  ORF type:complete len:255 (+),score=41.19 NODE_394_length_944_cov_161.638246_g386_i0:33-767(+)